MGVSVAPSITGPPPGPFLLEACSPFRLFASLLSKGPEDWEVREITASFTGVGPDPDLSRFALASAYDFRKTSG
jgi:hypothetical protein